MNLLYRLLFFLVMLLVPVVLVLGAVRIVLNPWYLHYEYRTPNFPEDPFGFTLEERLRYSRIALDYLLNEEDISFLAELRFPEGQQAPAFSCQFMEDCSRLYNERELKHMVDVKNVVQVSMRLLAGAAIMLAGVGIWAGWQKRIRDYLHALGNGGWLTLILIAGIILLVVGAFGVFFIFFHDVFFEEGTWTFYTSDTLIRLFPERFWRDTFLVVGGLAGGMGLILGLVARATRRRKTT